MLAEVGRRTRARPPAVTVLELAEIRARCSATGCAGRPTRANFRTGHLTVCTLVPMRSVPHRVVCLLGLDDGAFPAQAPPATATTCCSTRRTSETATPGPRTGRCCSTRCSRPRTACSCSSAARTSAPNAPRPPAVPVGELLDAIDRTARATAGRARARDRSSSATRCSAFDPRNFDAGALPGTRWGFDRSSLEGAARAQRANASRRRRSCRRRSRNRRRADRGSSSTSWSRSPSGPCARSCASGSGSRPATPTTRSRTACRSISTGSTAGRSGSGVLDGDARRRRLEGLHRRRDRAAAACRPACSASRSSSDSLEQPLSALVGAASTYTERRAPARSGSTSRCPATGG